MASEETDLKFIQEDHCKRLLNQLADMRRSHVLCDVKIACGTTFFKAHRCVLAAASPYFQCLVENFDSSEALIVPTDSHTMVIFLDYMYTGNFLLNKETLASALVAAHLFKLNDIYKHCSKEIVKELDVNNCMKLWKAVEKCNDKNLQKIIVNFYCQRIEEFLKSKTIEKCSFDQISAILSSKLLSPELTMKSLFVWLQNEWINRKSYLQFLWKSVALSPSVVSNLLKQEIFASASDFVESIKKLTWPQEYEKLVAEGSTKDDELSFLEKIPPLPPRRKPPDVTKSLPSRASKITYPPINDDEDFVDTSLFPILEPRPPEPPPRSMSLPAESAGEPHILIFGVMRNKRLAVQKYNLSQGTWSPSQDFNLPKEYFSPPVVTALEDRIYILGGAINALDFDSSVYVTSLENYPCREQRNMLLSRVHFATTALNGLLYVIGGRNRTGWLRDVERFNPEQNAWHQMAPLSEPKSASGVTVVQGRIYVVGGLKGTKMYSTATESYDPLADQWTQLEPLTEGRYRVGIAAISTKIYVLGGAREPNQRELPNFMLYDTENSIWQPVSSPHFFDDDQPCVLTWNNKMWVISRRNYCLFSYDPLSALWTQLPGSVTTQHWQYVKNILLMNL